MGYVKNTNNKKCNYLVILSKYKSKTPCYNIVDTEFLCAKRFIQENKLSG